MKIILRSMPMMAGMLLYLLSDVWGAMAQTNNDDEARPESSIVDVWRKEHLPPIYSRDYALGIAKQLKNDVAPGGAIMELFPALGHLSLAPYCLLPADDRGRIRRLTVMFVMDPAIRQEAVELLERCGLRIWQRSSTHQPARYILVAFDATDAGLATGRVEHDVLDARVVVLGMSTSDYTSMTEIKAAKSL